MTTRRITGVLAAACLGLALAGCSLFKKDKELEDGADAVEAAAAQAAAGAPGVTGPRPGQSGSAYAVSGNLRNPPITIPRVSGNTQASISRANVNGPFIAVTFDDGPHPSNTPELLDLLAQRNIKATFYVVGTNARRHPGILRRMVAEGHEIGNHTVNHLGLARISNEKVRSELVGCHQSIVNATGVPPTTIRPPYGSVTGAQKQWMFDEFGYTTVMWSVDPKDWQRPGPSVVARRLVEGTRNGSILLLHDIHSPTIDAVPQALDELLRRGYRFVTVSQLMAMQGAGSVASQVSAVEDLLNDEAYDMEPIIFGPPLPRLQPEADPS